MPSTAFSKMPRYLASVSRRASSARFRSEISSCATTTRIGPAPRNRVTRTRNQRGNGFGGLAHLEVVDPDGVGVPGKWVDQGAFGAPGDIDGQDGARHVQDGHMGRERVEGRLEELLRMMGFFLRLFALR